MNDKVGTALGRLPWATRHVIYITIIVMFTVLWYEVFICDPRHGGETR